MDIFNWIRNREIFGVDLTEPEKAFDWNENQKNLRVDSTEPDKSLGVSSTGIRIGEILVAV